MQLKFVTEAVRAADNVLHICLSPPRHVADAMAADVVFAARRHQDVVEVSHADGAVVLVDLLLQLICWEVVDPEHVSLGDFSLYPDLVPCSYLV